MFTRQLPPYFRLWVLVVCLVLALCGCMAESIPQGMNLAEADKAAIEEEVRQALDDYAAAIVSGDQDRIKAFWGDFEDFVHAGDGRVMGDRDTWFAWMDAHPGEIVSWEFSDIHVAVLAPNAASYTANFQNVGMDGGAESITTGSWTYVLRRTEEGWRVVHSNGKHNGFSYYD
jgi:ketosteroid isomerase-like protein